MFFDGEETEMEPWRFIDGENGPFTGHCMSIGSITKMRTIFINIAGYIAAAIMFLYLLCCTGCKTMTITQVKYTLGGGIFVPASIEVTTEQTKPTK